VQLEIASSNQALGRFREAESVLRRLTKRDSSNATAYVSLSYLMIDLDRLEEAETALGSALAGEPKSPKVMVALGQLARRKGRRDAALHCFRAAVAFEPDNPELTLLLAAELREQGDVDGAIKLTQPLANDDNGGAEAWIQLGLTYRAKSDRDMAVRAFRTAASKWPMRAQALVELAHESWAAGDPKQAAQFLQRALARGGSDAGALVTAAEHALEAQNSRKALEFARHAMTVHPGQLGPYLVGARAAADLLDRDEALQLLDRARAMLGDRPEIIATHIHILCKFKEYRMAQSVLGRAGAAGTTNFALWLEGASLAVAVGNFACVEQALNSAPEQSSKECARVHALRAMLAEVRCEYAAAIAGYRDALALDPTFVDCHRNIARLCLLTADSEGARRHLRAAFERNRASRIAGGRSTNISQDHTGQLIDELTIDVSVSENLKHIAAMRPELRIEPLRQLIRDDPDQTFPAILLLVALRQSDMRSMGAARPAAKAERRIPKRIVQFWHDQTAPIDIATLMETWRARHVDYRYECHNDSSAMDYLRGRVSSDVQRAFARAREPAQRADIFRLASLAVDGGVYIAADDRCLDTIDSLIPASADFVGYVENYSTIAGNFIGAVPGHPVIVRALQLAVDAVNRGDHDIRWLATGPGAVTRAFAQIAAGTEREDLLGKSVLHGWWDVQHAIGIHCPAAYKATGAFHQDCPTPVS
jgi:tetratricopeptide (TPR) repeat protein